MKNAAINFYASKKGATLEVPPLATLKGEHRGDHDDCPSIYQLEIRKEGGRRRRRGNIHQCESQNQGMS
jgi:hypothetical protein